MPRVGEQDMSHQILCVTRSARPDPHERITHIGGRNAGGSQWTITQQTAIEGIEAGRWSFVVEIDGQSVSVIIAVGALGNKYLKTQADGEQPDGLLQLRTCGR